MPDPLYTILIPSLSGGGAERMMVNLAIGLRELGERIEVVTGDAAGPHHDRLASRVDLIDLGCARFRGALVPLVRYLRERRPRVLVSTLNYANVVAAAAVLLARTRTALVLREANTPSAESQGQRAFIAKVIPRLQRLAYRRASACVAVSAGVAADLEATLGVSRDKIVVIGNPVVDEELKELSRARPQHEWLAVRTVPTILAVGRLTPQKDYRTLLQALAILRRRGPARLVIVGEGSERRALEDQARQLGIGDDVALPGFLSNPYALMANADVHVLSSRWEGLPNVLIEALACGASVVATDCPSGPREILDQGRYGRLVPVGDAQALATALGAALDGPRAAADQERWVARWSRDAIAREYLAVLRRAGGTADG